MKYFPNVPNIYINADGYLEGLFGLNWLPSEAAKAHVRNYEQKVADLLFGMWKSYTAAWVMLEITLVRHKRVEITPSEFAPDELKQNRSGGDIGAKTGTRDGSY